MADTREPYDANETHETAEAVSADNDVDTIIPDRPAGWMYRERKIGPVTIPWCASPKFQLILVSFVCFCCPGMYNALTGLGGGGRADPLMADNMVITYFLCLHCQFVLGAESRL